MPLIARVTITLKNGVLDPQGVATKTALGHIGFEGIEAIRQGKIIDVTFSHDNKEKAEKDIETMSQQLLANLVVENYSISWIES